MKLYRILFTVICASVLLGCQKKEDSKQKDKKPNIVFIMSDDHAYQAISAYSNKLIQTPNIDRIAKEGITARPVR